MRILISITFILLSLTTTLTSVSAVEEVFLHVSPVRTYETIQPGKEREITVSFHNQSKEAISGEIVIRDFIVQGTDGKPTIYDEETPLSARFSARSWVDNTHGTIAIQPDSKAALPFTIRVPSASPPGERYAAIMFIPSTTEKDQTNNSTNVQVSYSIGSLLTIRIPGEVTESALVSRMTTPALLEFGPIPLEADITNRSGYAIQPKGVVEARDLFGNLLERHTLPAYSIFPDASRTYKFSIGKGWMIGKYTLTLQAAYGERGQTVSRSLSVVVLPWKIIITVILSLLIFYFWRKSHQKAASGTVTTNEATSRLLEQSKKRD